MAGMTLDVVDPGHCADVGAATRGVFGDGVVRGESGLRLIRNDAVLSSCAKAIEMQDAQRINTSASLFFIFYSRGGVDPDVLAIVGYASNAVPAQFGRV